jgi:hypothetical protein
MAYRSKSRREALLKELCARGGYCSTGLTVDDLTADLSADEITEMVLRGEGLDPVMTDRKQAASVLRTVEDWLFDPRGQGIKSGLPHRRGARPRRAIRGANGFLAQKVGPRPIRRVRRLERSIGGGLPACCAAPGG